MIYIMLILYPLTKGNNTAVDLSEQSLKLKNY